MHIVLTAAYVVSIPSINVYADAGLATVPIRISTNTPASSTVLMVGVGVIVGV
jgi:hypothetical protein